MRKFLIPLLVASALAPAATLAQDGGTRGPRSEGERDSSSGDRPQRAERAPRIERSGGNDQAVRMDRAERPAQIERNIQQIQSVQSVQQVRRVERDQTVEPVKQVQQVQGVGSVYAGQPAHRVRRAERNNDGFAIRRVPGGADSIPESQVEVRSGGNRDGFAIRRVPRETSLDAHTEVYRDGDGDGFSGSRNRNVEHGDRNDGRHRWSGDWRSNKRYDWQNYRSRHGSLYRFGRYYDPYGWGYRRFSIGLSLWPSYYGSSFWLNDPWQYRLPPAYGPYRWVRYYDDALLVNIYTGQVVDVIHSFFW